MADFIGGACVQAPLTDYSVDILFDDANGTNSSGGGLTEWAFQIDKVDTTEILDTEASWGFAPSANIDVTKNDKTGTSILVNYLLNTPDPLQTNDLIGTLNFRTNEVLTFAPADALADITMFGVVDGLNQADAMDPVTGIVSNNSSFEVQTVPLPAAGLMMMLGLAVLSAFGVRRRG